MLPRGRRIYIELKSGPEIVPFLGRELTKSRLRPEQVRVIAFDADVIGQLKSRLDAGYEYEPVLSLPVKNSVSKITHRDDEFKVDYFAKTFTPDDMEISKADSSGVIDPRLVGTATHLVFENVPLTQNG